METIHTHTNSTTNRKAYQRPKLLLFGTISQITKTNVTGTANDGGTAGNPKRQS